MARLKTDIRVSAILRRAQGAGAFAAVLRRGDPDAGALWVIVRQGVELCRYTEQMNMSGARAKQETAAEAAAKALFQGR